MEGSDDSYASVQNIVRFVGVGNWQSVISEVITWDTAGRA